MKKVFISQPMRGLTDEEIMQQREILKNKIADILEECTDVIIISLSLICAISEEENLKEMFETKIKKWNEKTKNIK